MTGVRLLLDEHINRVFERVLAESGYHVDQVKDRFGERTVDRDLLEWCAEHDAVLVTNNTRDFEPLHDRMDHVGIFMIYDQRLPDRDPEGFARTIDEILRQYDSESVANETVDLDAWYAMVRG